MHVRAFGAVTLYEKRGDFQLVVRRIEATGAGGLWRVAFERLRTSWPPRVCSTRNADAPLPLHPRAVGVVTSPVGAVLHDILHVIRTARALDARRALARPGAGRGRGARHRARAAPLRALMRPADVIIVGRGGGSVEDLWAFNEEPVARAIAECPVPVISAVGHESTSRSPTSSPTCARPRRRRRPSTRCRTVRAQLQELAAARQRLPRALRRYAQGGANASNGHGERLETRCSGWSARDATSSTGPTSG
jgi:exodeoxyribonuclease VII large subunit